MHFDRQIAELIQRHMKEIYGWESPIEEILAEPRYERVWAYWNALAYFRMHDHYLTLEEAPEGIKWITVMDGTCKNYKWKNGKYEFAQELTKEDCKSIYGS